MSWWAHLTLIYMARVASGLKRALAMVAVAVLYCQSLKTLFLPGAEEAPWAHLVAVPLRPQMLQLKRAFHSIMGARAPCQCQRAAAAKFLANLV